MTCWLHAGGSLVFRGDILCYAPGGKVFVTLSYTKSQLQHTTIPLIRLALTCLGVYARTLTSGGLKDDSIAIEG
ncbi:MAG: hypothetical protein ABL933_04500 [Methyloglobulus sp.]|nr:hypothetical protein [Methyloglobulus sp.]